MTRNTDIWELYKKTTDHEAANFALTHVEVNRYLAATKKAFKKGVDVSDWECDLWPLIEKSTKK